MVEKDRHVHVCRITDIYTNTLQGKLYECIYIHTYIVIYIHISLYVCMHAHSLYKCGYILYIHMCVFL